MIIIDTHVHIYPCYDLAVLFKRAYQNFEKVVGATDIACALLLAESHEINWFDEMREKAGRGEQIKFGHWVLGAAEDPLTMELTCEKKKIFLIRGRQFVCQEGLEVLALCSPLVLDEKLPVVELIECIRASGGLVVLPWGFGKWHGKRGKILGHLLSSGEGKKFFLGDNGGRPSWLSSQFLRQAHHSDQRSVLPGSDPLPLDGEEHRVGSSGIIIDAETGAEDIRTTICLHLLTGTGNIIPFRAEMSLFRFIHNQVKLRCS